MKSRPLQEVIVNNQQKHGAFLHRDSGGRHDQSIEQYLEWAQMQSTALDLIFDGSLSSLREMIDLRCSAKGDIYLDYLVAGNKLSRPGLNALRERAKFGGNLTHVFIARRDRLARPNDPTDALAIENELRGLGITLVYQDKTVGPLKPGERQEIADLITGVVDFHKAGAERRDLASKVIQGQMSLARKGFSTGGRAPFGFRRALVDASGKVVRLLEDGEKVRLPGCHVAFVPGPEEEVRLALRIRELMMIYPATRVAQILNDEGIPSPDSGRTRMDNGILHLVTGEWNATSIVNIGRNPLFTATTRYGLRSMGDELRYSPDGPRLLNESDSFEGTRIPKVIRNDEQDQIRAKAAFDPLVSVEENEQLQQILNKRAGTQRGKPRSRKPACNPLGGRVFDTACGWPMYRVERSGAYKYTCGLYQQSHSKACEHNHVDGPHATKFALSSIQQRLLLPGMIEKLKKRLRTRTEQGSQQSNIEQELKGLQNQLTKVTSQLQTVSRNMALAETEEQRTAMQAVFNEIKTTERNLEAKIEGLNQAAQRRAPELDERQLMRIVERLQELALKADDTAALEQLFNSLNLRLFFKFSKEQWKKRIVNKVAGGMITFGNAEPPIPLYAGRTDTRSVRAALEAGENLGISSLSDEEVDSSRNVSRGDRI